MTRFRVATTRRLDADLAATELIGQAEAGLGQGSAGWAAIAGGFLLATAAAGDQGREVGRRLGDRWPEAELLGTSFEGVLGEGQVWRDEPALGLFVWEDAPEPPLSFVFDAAPLEPSRVAAEILEASGRARLSPADLLLLFPDATGSPGLPAFLNDLVRELGGPQLAGAAGSGLAGEPALGWSGGEACPGALLGLLVLDGAESTSGAHASPPGAPTPEAPPLPSLLARVSAASATRAASPWLEITACRTRWVDELEEEPPLLWIRRQLGLDSKARIEPYLDRLMARIRRRRPEGGGSSGVGHEADAIDEDGSQYDEQFLIGVDARRGAISVPGEFARGDELALALPDADLARMALRASVESLAPTELILQFACRARDEQLHGDRDLESALVAHQAVGRATLGTLAPFQLGPGPGAKGGKARLMVYSTVLAALGDASRDRSK